MNKHEKYSINYQKIVTVSEATHSVQFFHEIYPKHSVSSASDDAEWARLQVSDSQANDKLVNCRIVLDRPYAHDWRKQPVSQRRL